MFKTKQLDYRSQLNILEYSASLFLLAVRSPFSFTQLNNAIGLTDQSYFVDGWFYSPAHYQDFPSQFTDPKTFPWALFPLIHLQWAPVKFYRIPFKKLKLKPKIKWHLPFKTLLKNVSGLINIARSMSPRLFGNKCVSKEINGKRFPFNPLVIPE